MTDGITYELVRVQLKDADETTVYVVRHPLSSTTVRLVCFPEPQRLDHWCAANDHPEAIVGGFFLRDPYRPLGEARVDGELLAHEPVSGPWAGTRLPPHRRGVSIAPGSASSRPVRRPAAGRAPAGLRRSLVDRRRGSRGIFGGAAQFDSDITVGRYPRCALGVSGTELLSVCCDGRRSNVDGGLELGELARLLVSFGAEEAINLDGGGSANSRASETSPQSPYSDQDQPARSPARRHRPAFQRR